MNFAPTHCAVAEEQWANEGEALMTLTSTIEGDMGTIGNGEIFATPGRVEGEKKNISG